MFSRIFETKRFDNLPSQKQYLTRFFAFHHGRSSIEFQISGISKRA